MSGYIGRLPLTEAIQTRKSFVATAGQTTFSMAYQAGYIDVYLNGIKIREGASEDYVASNGTSIVLNSGVVVNTELDVVSLTSASIVDKLPTQSSSTNGKILQSDGTNASWATDSNTTYSVGDGGLSEINFTSADHSKLDGIATGANAYTHPTSAGNKHVPTGGSSGQFLKYSSSGTAVWASDNDTVYTHPTGDGNIHVPAYGSSTSGQLLTSTGTSSTPTWQDAPQGVSNSKLFYFGSFN